MSKTVSLGFISDNQRYDGEKPYIISELPDLTLDKQSNIEATVHDNITITNVRDSISSFTLEDNSFEWISHNFLSVLDGSEETNLEYAQECVTLLQTKLKADRIICYDVATRTNNFSALPYRAVSEIPSLPATIVHMDHSHHDGYNRIRRHLTEDEATRYLSGDYRLRIINLWRPLRLVEDCPLALCNCRTISMSSLVQGDLVTPRTISENCWVRYNPEQQWYWLSDQSPDEVTLFLQFDSLSEEKYKTNYCAHAAFVDPEASGDARPRQSVEVRLIVIDRLSSG